MKRSEMLDKLESLIWSTENIDVPSELYLKAGPLANEILDMLEFNGMMPPDNGDTDEFGHSDRTFMWDEEIDE